ncbi:MAG TPA: type II secretion system protein M [Steroidobacteraceae bacterium]|jgi:general secretion pathway protein M|nr:type II secretion system protein M [Steroidobacteraceae bacterium]
MKLSLDNLNDRERRMVTIGGVVAIVLLLVGVVFPLDHSVTLAQNRIGQKQADLQWMQGVTSELVSAGPVSAQQPVTQESLLVVVDRAAREAGLGSSLTNSEPSGAGGLRVRLEKAPFDILIGWLARLSDQNGIRVESATVDNAGAPGIVNAGIVLRTK